VEKISEHVGLICLYPDNDSVNHWLSELAGHLQYVRRHSEAKSGTLSFEKLFELLYNEPLETDRQKEILEVDCKSHMNERPVSGNLLQMDKLYHDLTALCLSTFTINVARVKELFAHRGIL
jgi:hypothetical protein